MLVRYSEGYITDDEFGALPTRWQESVKRIAGNNAAHGQNGAWNYYYSPAAGGQPRYKRTGAILLSPHRASSDALSFLYRLVTRKIVSRSAYLSSQKAISHKSPQLFRWFGPRRRLLPNPTRIQGAKCVCYVSGDLSLFSMSGYDILCRYYLLDSLCPCIPRSVLFTPHYSFTRFLVCTVSVVISPSNAICAASSLGVFGFCGRWPYCAPFHAA